MEMIRKISRILSGKQKAKVGLLIVMMLFMNASVTRLCSGNRLSALPWD